MLTTHTIAPDFSLLDQHQDTQTLHAYRGKWVLLYFYPKDDTPGCTKEACAIAEVFSEFKELGITVFGVSKDSPQSHHAFALKYHLPFILLSDPEGVVIEAYGAWQEKSMFGKKYMGIQRMSYLLNPEGLIEKIYPDVDPATHALEILKDVRALSL
jgi:thioredoxin-dependent peroxiredoxin